MWQPSGLCCLGQHHAESAHGLPQWFPIIFCHGCQWQANFCFTQTHHGSSGFDGNGIGFTKEQTIDLQQAVMLIATGGQVSFQKMSPEGHHLLGYNIGADGDDPFASHGQEGQEGGVVAGEQGDLASALLQDDGGAFHIGGGLFEGDDAGVFGQAGDGIGLHIDAGSAGYVIEHQG